MLTILKTLSEKKILHSSLVLFLMTQAQGLETVHIQSVLQVSQESILKKIDSAFLENATFEKTLTGLKYEAELPIAIDQIKLNFQLSPVQTHKVDGTRLISSNMAEMKITGQISNLQIHGIVAKEINGVRLNINIHSECKNIFFDANLIRPQLLSQFIGQDIRSEFDFQKLEMNFKTFSCTQVHGLAEYIQLLAQKILQDKLPIKQIVSEQITSLINDKIKLVKLDLIAQAQNAVQKIDSDSQLILQTYQFTQNTLNLNLDIQTLSDQERPKSKILNLSAISATRTNLVIDKNDFEFLIQNAVSKKFKALRYSSDAFPSFKNLLSSRFKQFFIWPALMKRPKNLPLELSPVLEKFTLLIPRQQETNKIDLQMTVGHWVKDQTQPMVYFRSEAAFQNVSLDQAHVVTLTNSYIWDQNYLKQKNVSEQISLNLINSTAKNLLQKTVNDQLLLNQNSFLKYFKSFLLSSENILQLFLE